MNWLKLEEPLLLKKGESKKDLNIAIHIEIIVIVKLSYGYPIMINHNHKYQKGKGIRNSSGKWNRKKETKKYFTKLIKLYNNLQSITTELKSYNLSCVSLQRRNKFKLEYPNSPTP